VAERDIAAILQNPAVLRQMFEEAAQASAQAAPTIPIPAMDVPADIVLHGKVSLIATFPWSSIEGLDEKTIYERVMEVLYGANGAWLPRVELGNLTLWQERRTDVQREPEPESNLVRSDQPRFAGTIPGLRDSGNEADAWHPELRIRDSDEEPDPFSEG
jgi:hypothetical protein